MPREQADYDSPWKEILEQFFEPCLRFFFPPLHAQIDWSQEVVFLDKELQQISFDAETGRHTVDKLVQVRLLGGAELWLLIHIEVQGQKEAAFTTRMYVYNYRLYDRYQQHVVSLAILTDENRHWRPDHYERELFGCRVRLDFPIIKLLDYEERTGELEQDENPFALVVLAHLRTLQTLGDDKLPVRKDFKKQLMRLTWQRGYRPKQTGQLLRFLDWVMRLSENLEQELQQELAVEEQQLMNQYVTSWERMAEEKGKLAGQVEALRQALQETLQLRFPQISPDMLETINNITQIDRLQRLHREAVISSQLEAFTEQLSLAE